MECEEARRAQRLHRWMMRMTLGCFVLWNYVVYLRVRYATKEEGTSLFDVDTNSVYDV